MLDWLFGGKRLRELGILGMNRRNAECILDHNPRALYPIVDDKLRMHELCQRTGIPTPSLYLVVEMNGQLRQLGDMLTGLDEFVIKPARGSAGRGIMVIGGRVGTYFRRHNGDLLTLDDLRHHVSDILSGMFSLGGRTDVAIFQQRVRLHPDFEPITFKGIPDVRVIVYRGEPAMAMLRLPTQKSGGRANLHQGGIGAGIDLATGRTSFAVQHNRQLEKHPDTGCSVIGRRVPYWDEVLMMSRKVARAVGLGYVGVDIIVDRENGPMLLEANARPGLAIQIANNAGLIPEMRRIDADLAQKQQIPRMTSAAA